MHFTTAWIGMFNWQKTTLSEKLFTIEKSVMGSTSSKDCITLFPPIINFNFYLRIESKLTQWTGRMLLYVTSHFLRLQFSPFRGVFFLPQFRKTYMRSYNWETSGEGDELHLENKKTKPVLVLYLCSRSRHYWKSSDVARLRGLSSNHLNAESIW